MKISSVAETEFSWFLHLRGAKLKMPVSGNFELTPRCNFDCKMCYIRMTAEEQRCEGRELTAEQWLSLGSDARDRGLVFLLLTGGEPLVRDDFEEIYSGLKKLGLVLSLNTNAALLSGDRLNLILADPPMHVNISLYGTNDETYESLCGTRAYTRVVQAIKQLREHSVPVKLNVSLSEYNISDLPELLEKAKELGAIMQTTSYLFPPVRRAQYGKGRFIRPEPEIAAKIQTDALKLENNASELKEKIQALKSGVWENEHICALETEKGMRCRAGRCSFWISWNGLMTPCGLMDSPAVKPLETGFGAAWETLLDLTDKIRMPGECISCKYRQLCNICAARCKAETGEFNRRPDYICRMTEKTAEILFSDNYPD